MSRNGGHAHGPCRCVSVAATTPRRRPTRTAGTGPTPTVCPPTPPTIPQVRRILRNRARYEVANNSYARGIVLTLANDCVGTGPRLQMLTDDAEANRLVEQEFMRWAEAIGLAEKLRTMRMARAEDGEAFAMLVTNPKVDSPVKLDLRLIEADQVTTPDLDRSLMRQRRRRHRLRRVRQPGRVPRAEAAIRATASCATRSDYDRVPAASMIHCFRADRPGQSRGIPEITPALPLFAQLRRYTLAVLAAAETAADFAGILYTDAPANGEADAVEPMDLIELERRMATSCRAAGRWARSRPSSRRRPMASSRSEILNEIARCLNMPFNVAAGNSSGYNYASGRLDHQTYYKSHPRRPGASRARSCSTACLAAWLDEAILDLRTSCRWPADAAFRDLAAPVVLGRAGARGPGQGSQRPGDAPAEPHHHPGRRIRPPGPGLGERTAPAGQGSGAHAGTGPDDAAGPASAAPDDAQPNEENDPMPTEKPSQADQIELDLRARCASSSASRGRSDRGAGGRRGAADGKPPLPRFTMVAYTGGPMRIAGWRYPVIVDLAGLAIPSQSRPDPLRPRHGQRRGPHRRHPRRGRPARRPPASSRATRPPPRRSSSRPATASPGRRPSARPSRSSSSSRRTRRSSVNGREFAGPVNVVRKATLGEISFVDLGADGQTSASVAAAAPRLTQEKPAMDRHVATSSETAADRDRRASGAARAAARPPAAAAGRRRPAPTRRPTSAPRPLAETNRIAAIRQICAGRHPEIEAQAIREGWDATRCELEVLRASRPKAPAVHVRDNDRVNGTGAGGGLPADGQARRRGEALRRADPGGRPAAVPRRDRSAGAAPGGGLGQRLHGPQLPRQPRRAAVRLPAGAGGRVLDHRHRRHPLERGQQVPLGGLLLRRADLAEHLRRAERLATSRPSPATG